MVMALMIEVTEVAGLAMIVTLENAKVLPSGSGTAEVAVTTIAKYATQNT